MHVLCVIYTDVNKHASLITAGNDVKGIGNARRMFTGTSEHEQRDQT